MPLFLAMLVALSALAACQTTLDASLGSHRPGDLDADVQNDASAEDPTAAPAVSVASGDKPAPPLDLDAGSEEPTGADAGEDEPGDDGGFGDDDGRGGDDGPGGDGPGGDDGP